MHEKILLQKEAAVNTFAKRYSLISLANKRVVSFIAYWTKPVQTNLLLQTLYYIDSCLLRTVHRPTETSIHINSLSYADSPGKG